jgi:hypothetical protein
MNASLSRFALAIEVFKTTLEEELMIQSCKCLIHFGQRKDTEKLTRDSIGSYGPVLAMCNYPRAAISNAAKVLMTSCFPIGKAAQAGTVHCCTKCPAIFSHSLRALHRSVR